MERRAFLLSAGSVAAGAATAGCGVPLVGGSASVDAVVTAKSVTGTKGDASHGIVLAHRDALSVDDEDYAGAFDDWRDVTVDDDLRERLTFEYRDLRYNFHLRRSGGDGRSTETGGDARDDGSETLAYRASRADFNAAQVTDAVTARVDDGDVPRVESLSVSGDE